MPRFSETGGIMDPLKCGRFTGPHFSLSPGFPMQTNPPETAPKKRDPFRFHHKHAHLTPTFGESWFALKAEAFARFFGTPLFLGGQTLIVAVWIVVNVTGIVKFDVYPFILLNLAFSLQAAYAAPLILLAQTRQADRDKVNSDADARHREDLASANEERQLQAARQTDQLVALLEQNTKLTEITKQMSERIEALTREVHNRIEQANIKP